MLGEHTDEVLRQLLGIAAGMLAGALLIGGAGYVHGQNKPGLCKGTGQEGRETGHEGQHGAGPRSR